MNYIDKKIDFENKIFDLNEELFNFNYEEIFKLYSKEWIQMLISYTSLKRIFSYKYLGDLFAKTGKKIISFNRRQDNCFPTYLLCRNIIKREEIDSFFRPIDTTGFDVLNEYEEPIKVNTLEWFIQQDNVSLYLNYITNNDININSNLINIVINEVSFTIMDFICFNGSINILKYYFLNNFKLNSLNILRTVQGGNENVIEFLHSNNITFNGMLVFVIEYHHNKIAKWIYENYSDSNFSLSHCVQYFNTEMFLYFLIDKGFDINIPNNQGKLSIDYAKYNNDKILIDFINNYSTK